MKEEDDKEEHLVDRWVRFLKFLLTVVVAAVFLWAVTNAIATTHPTDAVCRDVLYQVNRGPSFSGEVGGREFTCPSPQHFMEPPLELSTQSSSGVYICRCKDMHKMAQQQNTEIEMLFSRIEYLEKRGVAPVPAEQQQIDLSRKLDHLERELHKKAPLEEKK